MAIAAESMGRASAARERRWARIQAASGLAFGAFAAVHLANQWLAPLAPRQRAAAAGATRAARRSRAS